ncbi:RHS repeat-associated core domain-containing protein [Teredinibacter turnerae]|uniref:RHS repeat-associated core domain-containing protein n=1 Tax=Teredinibacter turnerae TaxID=2426 RepID=UPI0018AD580A|nr:RHS repeat-associated core domain-containing protein [Teredinibacter turnerae]
MVAVTNSAGSLLTAVRYDAYGKTQFSNQSYKVRFGFQGQMYLAEVDVYHFKSRAYFPKFGRFLQPDVVGYADGLNMYPFVHNDPVNNVDPRTETDRCGNDLSKTKDVHCEETISYGYATDSRVDLSMWWMESQFRIFGDGSFGYEGHGRSANAECLRLQRLANENPYAPGIKDFGELLFEHATNLKVNASAGAAYGGFGANFSASREIDGDNRAVRVAWASSLGAFGGVTFEGAPLSIGELGNYTQSASFSFSEGLAAKFNFTWSSSGFQLSTGFGVGLGWKVNIVDFGYSEDL